MGFQAIVTKYHGPTNTKGSRIKATSQRGSVWVEYDDGLTTDANHTVAARKLAEKWGWTGRYVSGGLPDGSGNVYVLAFSPVANEDDAFTL